MRVLFISLFFYLYASGQPKEAFLNYNTGRLYGSVPNKLSKPDLLRILGKPTKIAVFEGECGLTDEQENAKERNIYYYDSTQYFVYDNKAELYHVNFRNGKFTYRTDKINLSNKTRFRDIEKLYPVSTHAAILENKGTMVRIPACPDCDSFCLLYFEKGRLVSLEWWEPC